MVALEKRSEILESSWINIEVSCFLYFRSNKLLVNIGGLNFSYRGAEVRMIIALDCCLKRAYGCLHINCHDNLNHSSQIHRESRGNDRSIFEKAVKDCFRLIFCCTLNHFSHLVHFYLKLFPFPFELSLGIFHCLERFL